MTLLLMLAGLMAGMTIPVQTAVNSRLRDYTKSPFIASWVSFFNWKYDFNCFSTHL